MCWVAMFPSIHDRSGVQECSRWRLSRTTTLIGGCGNVVITMLQPNHHTAVRLPGRVAMSPARVCIAASAPVGYWSTTEPSYQQWLVDAAPLASWDTGAPSQVHSAVLTVPSGIGWVLVINNLSPVAANVSFDVFY